jgi:hypothetical protein
MRATWRPIVAILTSERVVAVWAAFAFCACWLERDLLL